MVLPLYIAMTAAADNTDELLSKLRLQLNNDRQAAITTELSEIAGGAEATIIPLAVAGFMNMKALSESDDANSASLPFDARRAG